MDNEARESKINLKNMIEDSKNSLIKMFDGSMIDSKERLLRNCMGFIGLSGGVGTTTITYEVAILLKEEGYTVCIVDLDLTKPSQMRYHIQDRANVSIKDLLNGVDDIGKGLVRNKEGITFLETSFYDMYDIAQSDNGRKDYDNMKDIVEKLKDLYGVVLLDLNIPSLNFNVVQGALKQCKGIIGIVNDGSASEINKAVLERYLYTTTLLEPYYIQNMHHKYLPSKYDISLPYSSEIIKNDNDGNSYLLNGTEKNNELADGLVMVKNKVYEILGRV